MSLHLPPSQLSQPDLRLLRTVRAKRTQRKPVPVRIQLHGTNAFNTIQPAPHGYGIRTRSTKKPQFHPYFPFLTAYALSMPEKGKDIPRLSYLPARAIIEI